MKGALAALQRAILHAQIDIIQGEQRYFEKITTKTCDIPLCKQKVFSFFF